MTHRGVGYSKAEDLMLMAEEAVEIRVLDRQGKSIREVANARVHGTTGEVPLVRRELERERL